MAVLDALQAPRTLPHSEESERAVLAGILLEPQVLATVAARLVEGDFYFERHQRIYRAMLDLQAAGTDVDLRTLQARLEQQGQIDGVGGLAYLSGLDVDLPDLGRIDSYVEIVKERSLRRRLIQACTEVTRSALDGGLEANEALGKAEQAILGLGEEAVARGFVSLGRVLDRTMEDLEERPGSTLIGIPTGFTDLDRMTHGLNKGNLIIIAGRPGMGKTSLALNVAQYVAIHQNKPVGVFSLEMSEQELALRILCSEADVSFSRLRAGHLSQKQWQSIVQTVRRLAPAPLYIDDSPNPSMLEIASKTRRLRAELGLELIILDYLQLMQAGGRYENRNLEIAAISRSLKQLAKELEIPVIALSQLSRQPERRSGDHRPQLSDLRESGCLTGDTLITLADSGARVPMRDLCGRSGFAVWALDADSSKLRQAFVSHAFSTGVKPIFRLTTRLGRSIRGTANHRFLTTGGWSRLDQLTAGARLALPSANGPSELLSGSAVAAARADGDIYWDDLSDVTSCGDEEVFDLTVPGPHNFVADDIVVHNSIEQDADLVAFVYRDEIYNPDDPSNRGLAELIIAKHRNGETGTVELVFLGETTTFKTRAPDYMAGGAPP